MPCTENEAQGVIIASISILRIAEGCGAETVAAAPVGCGNHAPGAAEPAPSAQSPTPSRVRTEPQPPIPGDQQGLGAPARSQA